MSTQTESIEITGLPPGTISALEQIGRTKEKSVEELLREMIEAQILSERSFDVILAPIRHGFKDSGMTEAELDALFEEAREEVHQEKRARKE